LFNPPHRTELAQIDAAKTLIDMQRVLIEMIDEGS
jgi:hypothetical protein